MKPSDTPSSSSLSNTPSTLPTTTDKTYNSTTIAAMNDAHGVSYPPNFLQSLERPASPVYLLPAKAFEQLHLSHIISHPQDHVLFPFLHGLEGDNESQNAFFATAPNAHETHLYTNSQRPRVKVPKYRGLTWVVCEEDLESAADLTTLRILRRSDVQELSSNVSSPAGSSVYSSSSDSYEDEDYDIQDDQHIGVANPDDGGMQVHVDEHMPMSIVNEEITGKTLGEDPDNQPHMHPVSHRAVTSATTPIPVPSSASSIDTSASSGASFSFDTSTSLSTMPDSDLTSVSSCSPTTETVLDGQTPGPEASNTRTKATGSASTKKTNPVAPPLLTGTFRPKELIRRMKTQTNGEWDWEFVPAYVPEGISLRNFGIQVPIYATVSDIVIYSPKGASPATITLAQRFARAIENKRHERRRALGFSMLPDDEDVHRLLKYNVFVLDATESDMRKEFPHLMVRYCGEPVSGGLFGSRQRYGAHTDGPDGHVVELNKIQSEETAITEGVVGAMDVDDEGTSKGKESTLATPYANTVDFAQREKEEMRDLTKASEIISLFPISMSSSPLGSPGWSSQEDGSPSTQQRHRSHSNSSSHHPYRSTRPAHLQFLPHLQPPSLIKNFTFSPPSSSFDISSTSTYYDPQVGQVFLGNSGDVPLSLEAPHISTADDDPFEYETTNNPSKGFGFDICIECHDLATFPSAAHLRAAEEHLNTLDIMWGDRYERHLQSRYDRGEEWDEAELPPRPPPHANAIIHLTLPSSPSNTQATLSSMMPVIRFLEKWLRPVPPPPPIVRPTPPTPSPPSPTVTPSGGNSSGRRWSSVTSFMPSFVPFGPSSPKNPTSVPPRNRSYTSPAPTPIPSALKPKPRSRTTRPLKILIYSSDGYTESSVPALCLLMAIKGLTLPEAYLELQIAKKRSFFVYTNDLGMLRRMEVKLKEERERSGLIGMPGSGSRQWNVSNSNNVRGVGGAGTRPSAKSVSFASPSDIPGFVRSPMSDSMQQPTVEEDAKMEMNMTASLGSLPSNGPPSLYTRPTDSSMSGMMIKGRPRANTSPWLPSFGGDHQAWFNDPRFDGSFPSRVLPFLYLGNLNHASNVYMLHALGITHVVSVGECALVPPSGSGSHSTSPNGGGYTTSGHCNQPGHQGQAHYHGDKGQGAPGSLWIEEREGRIKVLDIKGVCDDGIDTLEPQLEPICEWIDKARLEGGHVLVHCRVGVSRSATVTIAYVMKHLNLSLVDSYLIVRSRRLSVLIQPNMRLLYNLCGWEIKLAKQRAGGDEKALKTELSRTLSWPYLAKEVHALNEKYLH